MSKVDPNQEVRELKYWQLSSEIESGRAEVLKMVAQQEPLDKILNTLCANSEVYNPEMKTSVLRLNQEKGTLHPCASVSLPKEYCHALDGVAIGLGVGSCGTAAFLKERVIVEDINTHSYWAQYKELALSAGLQSCWSEPIIGANGQCFGTFAIYYDEPKSPKEEDLNFIETCANLAAVVFESEQARTRLLEANNRLNQTINERNQQLLNANAELTQLIEQKSKSQLFDVNREKSETTRMLLMGFAHEINTPLGVALTCESHVKELVEELIEGIDANRLSKSLVLDKLKQSQTGIGIALSNLHKATELITSFKEIDIQGDNSDGVEFKLDSFFQELLERHSTQDVKIDYEGQRNLSSHSKYVMWQVFSALLENSKIHGFANSDSGAIKVYASKTQNGIEFNYQDNGVGLADGVSEEIFEPFYSTDRASGKMGLGLSKVRNILTSVYRGSIELIDSPIGIRFRIVISDR